MDLKARVFYTIRTELEKNGVEITQIGEFQLYNPYGETDLFLRTVEEIDERGDPRFLKALEDLWHVDANTVIQFADDCVRVKFGGCWFSIYRVDKLLYVSHYMEKFVDTPQRMHDLLPESTLCRFPPGKAILFVSSPLKLIHLALRDLMFYTSGDSIKNQEGEFVEMALHEDGFTLTFSNLQPRVEL